MIEVNGLSFAYGDNPILRDVTFTVNEGETLGLIGPNGSGKTTLLRQLHGGLKPAAGTVFFEGHNIETRSPRDMARQVAIVVQEPPGDLNHTVADTVLMGRIPHLKPFQRHGTDDEMLAVDALERVGALHLAARGLDELSGGEKQRVLMARALVQEARCLLLDEPTNHLDIGFQHQLLALVRKLELTTVAVLHDLNLAARYCDSIALLNEGGIRAIGHPNDVLTPESIAEVYGVGVENVTAEDGTHQLLFHQEKV